MMRVALYAVATLAVLLVVFLIVASRQPDTFRVERAAMIAAPPATVFAQVDDLHNWRNWSPWQELDPNMTQTYTGPRSGAGASMAWSGNSKAGQGRMTVVESHLNDLVAFGWSSSSRSHRAACLSSRFHRAAIRRW